MRGRDSVVILGIDTATRDAAIGLAHAGRPVCAAHLEGPTLRTRGLLAGIDELTRDVGLSRSELDGVAVGVGPGSFTGLRVGIAAAQAVALGLGVPIAAVSTLECVARNAPDDVRLVAVLIDAGRGEVFLGTFERSAGVVAATSPPRVMSPGQAAEAVPLGATLLGDGWLRYRGALERLLGERVRTLPEVLSRPSGAVIAQLGESALTSGGGGVTVVEPIYVRAPDAKLYEPRPASPDVPFRAAGS